MSDATTEVSDPATSAAQRLIEAACVFAVAPTALGGVQVRARHGAQREVWLALVRDLLPTGFAMRRLGASTTEDTFDGGIDLAATLAAGQTVRQRSVISAGGGLILPSAERLKPGLAARLAQALDNQGDTAGEPLALLALDESIDDEALPSSLSSRLALLAMPDVAPVIDLPPPEREHLRARVLAARQRLAETHLDDTDRHTLAAAALAFDIPSSRTLQSTALVARILAALDGAPRPTSDHISSAIGHVLVPRARRLPQPIDDSPAPEPEATPDTGDATPPEPSDQQLEDRVLAAALANLPAGLLAQIESRAQRTTSANSGADGATRADRHGRPIGSRAGRPDQGRIDLIATLRAAAPWQTVRSRSPGAPIAVRRSDFRIKRNVRPVGTTHIFVVDASGSSALHRLAEAKGAVELLLAECYVRRDQVALIAFRGTHAEVLLPPTRALARAKRALATLPGGGGTPLASGLILAGAIAAPLRRRGDRTDLVVLTDGRGNIDAQGRPGRAGAERDTLAAAKALRASGTDAIVIDTSPRPDPASRKLADALAARYLPLPFGDARTLSNAVRDATPSADRR